jgi:hypothetical protein
MSTHMEIELGTTGEIGQRRIPNSNSPSLFNSIFSPVVDKARYGGVLGQSRARLITAIYKVERRKILEPHHLSISMTDLINFCLRMSQRSSSCRATNQATSHRGLGLPISLAGLTHCCALALCFLFARLAFISVFK